MSRVKRRVERSRRLGKQARADARGASAALRRAAADLDRAGHANSGSEQFQRELAESAELGASAERNQQLARGAAKQTTQSLRAASRLLRRARGGRQR